MKRRAARKTTKRAVAKAAHKRGAARKITCAFCGKRASCACGSAGR